MNFDEVQAAQAELLAIVKRERDAEAATMRDQAFRRAPGPVHYLEAVAIGRGAPDVAAERIVADVLGRHANDRDDPATWRAILEEVNDRTAQYLQFKTERPPNARPAH